MANRNSTRRDFIKRTSIGTAGLVAGLSVSRSLSAFTINQAGNLAVLGGTPVRTEPYPDWPFIDEEGLELYIQAFREKNWSQFRHTESETTLQFEHDYAELMGVDYCCTTNTGTLALTAALRAVGVGPSDEVVVPTNTFVATAQAVYNLYALAIFVDSDPNTFMIDADKIEEKINENTKAILPVHIGGGACDMDKILSLSEKYAIPVVEDACQAHMGEWRGKKLGAVGDLGCFSFQQFKSITSGEGGAIVGDDPELMNFCFAYKNNGRDLQSVKDYPGTNMRMSSFQVAVVRGQMQRVHDLQRNREENARHLEQLLGEVEGIKPADKYEGQTGRAYYGYYLHYDKSAFRNLSRDEFAHAVREEGVPISTGCDTLNRDSFVQAYLETPHFQQLFSSERLQRFREENHCPNNDLLAQETGLSLGQPVFLGTKQDVENVVESIVKVQSHADKLI